MSKIQSKGQLIFTLPHNNTLSGGTGSSQSNGITLQSSAIDIEYTDEANYTWSGKIINNITDENGIFTSTPTHGYTSIVARQGGYGGFFQFPDHFYKLEYLKNNISILIEQDLSKYDDDCGLEQSASPPSPTSPNDFCNADDDCPAVVSILVLVTPEAQSYYMESDQISVAVTEAIMSESINIAFLNSGIQNKKTRIIFDQLNDFPYSNPRNANIDALTLANQNTTFSYTSALNKRNFHKADLVVMLTNRRYFIGPFSSGPTINGTMFLGPINEAAYGIVEAPSAVSPTWTFAHELGHAFGCLHDWLDDNTPGCNHGHLFGPPNTPLYASLHGFSTFSANEKVLHFSNPEIEYEGFSTGQSGNFEPANNARVISNTACIVADFFPTQELTAFISGPPINCASPFPATHHVQVNTPEIGLPGQGPYTYEWRWNTDGIFTPQSPGNFLSTSSSVSTGVLACPFYFLQVKVTSSDNITVNRTRQIVTELCNACQNNNNQPLTEQNNSYFSVPNLTVFPNPANETINIQLKTLKAERVKIALYNVNGQVIKSLLTDDLETGLHYFKFDVDALPPALYFLKIKTNNNLFSKKIILQ